MTLKRNCKESVVQYLTSQNRPYSANDVMQNLHKEFGKSAIQKALDDLTCERKIKEKSYGKQKVYSVMQEDEDGVQDAALELVTLDSQIQEANEKLSAAELELKKVEGALRDLESEPSTEKALHEKIELEMLLTRLRERIATLSEAPLELTEKEKNKILRNFEHYTKEHRKRKQICMDIINSIMENYPKRQQTLFEEIGIETDEVL